MGLKIKANTFATSRYLEVHSAGITFCETAALGGKRHFSFWQIDYVCISPQSLLSIQAGTEVFSLPVKPKHQPIIDAMLHGLQQCKTVPGAFPVKTR